MTSIVFPGPAEEVPRADVIAMRNMLVHHYFGIDLALVRGVATTRLSAVKARVVEMLRDMERTR